MATPLMPERGVPVALPPAHRPRTPRVLGRAPLPTPRTPDDVSVLPLFAAAAAEAPDAPIRAGDPAFLRAPESAIEQSFAAFHRANPQVYRELEKMALDALAQLQRDGVRRKRLGIKAFFEVLRYQRWLHTTTGDAGDYRLNNNTTALYARLLIWRHPALDGVIELRERRERNAHDDHELTASATAA